MPRLYVLRETRPTERRVAAVPETVQRLVAAGFEVEIQAGAGLGAGFSDASFQAASGRIVPAGADGAAALRQADVVFKVLEPRVTEVDQLRPGALLFALLDPFRNLPLVRRLAERGIGGNCVRTRVDEEVNQMDVIVPGPGNLPAIVPADASEIYARKLCSLLMLCFAGQQIRVDLADELIAGALLTHAGAIRNPAIAALLADTAIRA